MSVEPYIEFRSGIFPSIVDTRIIKNGKIILSEIPKNDIFIRGYSEITEGLPNSAQFIVDYKNAFIRFNESENGITIRAAYTGIGYFSFRMRHPA